MYVSIGTGQVNPEHVNDLVKSFEQYYEQHRDESRKPKGWREAYMLVDGDQHHFKIVGFWDSEADSKAFETSPVFGGFMKSIQGYLVGTPSREALKVAAHIAG